MKVVLFCGGLGLRMREESTRLPKPMIPLGQFRDTFIIAIDENSDLLQRVQFFVDVHRYLRSQCRPADGARARYRWGTKGYGTKVSGEQNLGLKARGAAELTWRWKPSS